MLTYALNALDKMHCSSSLHASRFWLTCSSPAGCPSVHFPECSQSPSSSPGTCHSRTPAKSSTHIQSGTPSCHGNQYLPDEDLVVYHRDRLDTHGDPRFDPKAAAEEQAGRRLSPIGSRRPSSPTSASSRAGSNSSEPAVPPGLTKGDSPRVIADNPVTRPASTSSWGTEGNPNGMLRCSQEDEFEAKLVCMEQIRKLRTSEGAAKKPSSAFSRQLGNLLRERPYFGSYACPIECPGFRCANCTSLKSSGNLLAAKIGQRTINARLLRVTPLSQWPYVEDKRKVLALRESYRRGSERALAELSLQY